MISSRISCASACSFLSERFLRSSGPSMSHLVELVRGHGAALSGVSLAVAAVGAVFLIARPAHHPQVAPRPPDHGLSYTTVDYTAADARSAFRAQGIAIDSRSQTP